MTGKLKSSHQLPAGVWQPPHPKVCSNTSRDKELTACQKGDQPSFESLHLLEVFLLPT